MEKLYPIVRRVRRPLLPPEEPPQQADVTKPVAKEVTPQIPLTKPEKTKRDDQPAVK